MTKRNTQKEQKIGKAVFSAAMIASVLASPSVLAEAAPNHASNMTAEAASQRAQGKVSPDATFNFELPLNKDNLKSLGLQYKNGKLQAQNKNKKDSVGVFIQNNNKEQMATQGNGQLTITTDGTTLFLEASVEGELDAHSTATATVLTGSAMNKFNAQKNSNGNAKSFAKHMEKESFNDQLQQSVEVGSAIGEASIITVGRPEGAVLTNDEAVIEFTATDDYGNPAVGASVTFEGATDLLGNPVDGVTSEQSTVEFVDGKAVVTVNSDKTQLVLTQFELDNGVSETTDYQIPVQFVKVVESGSNVELRYEENADGSVTVGGTVEKDGERQADVGVPLEVDNGTLDEALPVTDENGEFSVVIEDVTDGAFPEVIVDEAIAPEVEVEDAYASPVLSGTNEWTQTRVVVTKPYTLIQIDEVDGEWGEDLYAKVGENGTPVKVGSGGFVTGTTGRLYLGAYDELHNTDLKASVKLTDVSNLELSKVMTFSAAQTEINAGNTSTTTLNGFVRYGDYALVDGEVQLSTTLGSLEAATLTTDANGAFNTKFYAGTESGTAEITAQMDDVAQSSEVNVKKAYSNLKVDLDYIRPYSQGIEYSLDEGATWKQVWIFNSFNNFVWDEANEMFIGYGRSARMWYSRDGLKWYSSYNASNTTFDGIKGMVVSDDGVAIAIRGSFDSSRPTTTYLDGSRYKEAVHFLKSTNGGRTWTEVFYGNNHQSWQYLANDSFTSAVYEDGKFVIELQEGQILESADDGQFWKDIETGDYYGRYTYRFPNDRNTYSRTFKLTALEGMEIENGTYSVSTTAVDETLRHLTSEDGKTWTDSETGENFRFGVTVSPGSSSNSYRVVAEFTAL